MFFLCVCFPGATALYGAAVSDGTGLIVLDDLGCRGTEPRLVDCPHAPLGIHNCVHSEDVGVRCTTTTPTPGKYIQLEAAGYMLRCTTTTRTPGKYTVNTASAGTSY